MNLYDWLVSRKGLIRTFICTYLWGLAAHGYCYFNVMNNGDSMYIKQNAVEYLLRLGRFSHGAYFRFRGHFFPPVLIGLLSLGFLAAAIYGILFLLDLRDRASIFLVTGILTVNSALTLTNAAVLHDSDIYMLALLLGVLGAVFTRRWKWGFLPGAACLCISLGFYQSYFQAAVYLFMILAVTDLLRGKDAGRVFLEGVRAIAALLLGLVSYKLILDLLLKWKGLTLLNTYNGISGAGQFSSVSALLEVLRKTYISVWNNWKSPLTFHRSYVGMINVLLLVLTLAAVVVLVLRRRLSALAVLLLAAVLALMPFGMNLAYFMANAWSHGLMIYSFFLTYLLCWVVLREFVELKEVRSVLSRRKLTALAGAYAVPLLMTVVIFQNLVFSNQTYLKKQYEYQSTLLTMNRIVARMEETEGYVMGETQVVLIGTLTKSDALIKRDGFNYQGYGQGFRAGISQYGKYEPFFDYILAYPINLAGSGTAKKWAKREEVKAMHPFPAADCCRMIDGVLVVKIS